MAVATLTPIEALRQEIIRRRDLKIDAAKSEADRALGALNIVADMLSDDQLQDATTNFVTDSDKETRKPLPTAAWVAEIINDLNGSIISQPLIFERLMDRHAADFAYRDSSSVKAQIAMILKRFEARGDLIVHKKAYASDPTEYRKRTISQKTPSSSGIAKEKDEDDWE
jgi:hypothetical protein